MLPHLYTFNNTLNLDWEYIGDVTLKIMANNRGLAKFQTSKYFAIEKITKQKKNFHASSFVRHQSQRG